MLVPWVRSSRLSCVFSSLVTLTQKFFFFDYFFLFSFYLSPVWNQKSALTHTLTHTVIFSFEPNQVNLLLKSNQSAINLKIFFLSTWKFYFCSLKNEENMYCLTRDNKLQSTAWRSTSTHSFCTSFHCSAWPSSGFFMQKIFSQMFLQCRLSLSMSLDVRTNIQMIWKHHWAWAEAVTELSPARPTGWNTEYLWVSSLKLKTSHLFKNMIPK